MTIINPGQLNIVVNKHGGVDITYKDPSGHSKHSSSENNLSGLSPQDLANLISGGYRGQKFTSEQIDLIKGTAAGQAKVGQSALTQAQKAATDAYYPTETSHLDQKTGAVTDVGKPTTYSSGSYLDDTTGKRIATTGIQTQGNATTTGSGATTKGNTFSLTSGNLQQGSSGQNVKDLQTMLGITADGIFGPQTAAAVKAYQTAHGLSADGIVGPQTVASFSNSGSGSNSSGITQAVLAPDDPSYQFNAETGKPNPNYDPSAAGSTTAGALFGSIADVSQTLASSGSGFTWDQALEAAKKDPNIIAKYSDMLKLDTQGFAQSLDQLQKQTSTDSLNQQRQFEADRKQLAESAASAGQAYSGLRTQAQNQLGESESGIVASSKSVLQDNLNNLTSAFEARYGTDATKAAKAQFQDPFTSSDISLGGLKTGATGVTSSGLSGQLAGGITGSVPVQKESDIQAKAGDIYNLNALPA